MSKCLKIFCFPIQKNKKSNVLPMISNEISENNLTDNNNIDISMISIKKFIEITTKYTEEELEILERTPRKDERKIFKYLCPICFRQFNNILNTSCCKNYICYHCINLLKNKEIEIEEFKTVCCHCCSDNFYVHDVDINAPIRKYIDTPMHSLNSTKNNMTNQSPVKSPEKYKEDYIDSNLLISQLNKHTRSYPALSFFNQLNDYNISNREDLIKKYNIKGLQINKNKTQTQASIKPPLNNKLSKSHNKINQEDQITETLRDDIEIVQNTNENNNDDINDRVEDTIEFDENNDKKLIRNNSDDHILRDRKVSLDDFVKGDNNNNKNQYKDNKMAMSINYLEQ